MTALPPRRGDRSRAELAWLAAVLAVAVAVRVIALGADPMPELDGGFTSDAGTWWKNPRLHAVWGRWMVDDGNFGILTAPAYTVVMRAAFAVLGVGYAQAYATSALSGALAVLLVYLIVRREASATSALLAAALAGVNVLTVAYDRSSYPESFQSMMMLAAVGAILAARGRAWLAALAGLATAIVLLSKPPGLVLAPVAASTWAAHWLLDRARGERVRWDVRGMASYAVAAIVPLAIVGVVWLAPYAGDVWLHFRHQMREGAAIGALVTDRVTLFGTRLGFRMNAFFRLEWYLVLPAALFGALRIARVVRRPLTAVEIACWIWLVFGGGVMGMQTYQQDRRFLFLIPPLAILTSLLLAEAVELAPSAWATARARRLGLAGAAAVLALVAGLYAAPYGTWKVIALGELLGRRWTEGTAGGILLSAAVVGAAVAGALVAPRLAPAVRWRGSARWQLALVALPLALALVRVGREIGNRTRGLERVATTLDRISATWPESERVAFGWAAGTLTLGSRVLPINHELKGPPPVERFNGQLELYVAAPGREPDRTDRWALPGRPAKVFCTQMPIWNTAAGQPRLMVHVFVEPDRVAACRQAAGAPAPQTLGVR